MKTNEHQKNEIVTKYVNTGQPLLSDNLEKTSGHVVHKCQSPIYNTLQCSHFCTTDILR